MHELPVTQSIINIATEEAEKHNASKVSKIKLVVGELTGMVPECIQYYFDLLGKNTVLEGAELKLERLPLIAECKDCKYEGKMAEFTENTCPICKSTNIRIKGGNEFYIDSMEVE